MALRGLTSPTMASVLKHVSALGRPGLFHFHYQALVMGLSPKANPSSFLRPSSLCNNKHLLGTLDVLHGIPDAFHMLSLLILTT